MLAIDTLQTARRYQEAGLTTEQAEAYTAILKDAHQESIENLASKDDIALVRKDMELLRKDMATKDDLAAVKDDLATVKATVALHGWMLGILIAGVAALVLKAFFGT